MRAQAAAKEAQRSGRSLESLTSTTAEGLTIDPVYFGDDDSAPGVFPFTRGAYATMYAAKPWTIRAGRRPFPHSSTGGAAFHATDHRPVRGLLVGGGVERLLPAQRGRGPAGAERGL